MSWSQLSETMRRELFRIGDTPISLSTLITLLLILLVSFWVSKLARRGVQRLLGRKNPSAASSIGALLHYAILVIGFSIALSTAGIDLTALFAAGAIFAVGLGFAMQSIVQNFVSGVILISERSIKPGDIIEVEGRVVKVEEMGIRASIVLSRDGEELIIPNSTLAQTTVKNYTLRDSHFRVKVRVGVAYGSDMKRVRSCLEKVAQEVSKRWGVAGRTPSVFFIEFGASSVNWDVAVWMSDPWESRRAASDLHQAIWDALKENELVIAFPQLDVHMDPSFVSALRGESFAPTSH